MKIGILGTRGIPNNHGGFEQLAEYLSVYLVNKGHEVIVYNSHKHPYQEKTWNGVKIAHCFDLEHKIGTAGQFIYDLNCIRDSRKRDYDVLLQLGYTSSSIWYKLLPKKAIILTNMDGLEWKRTKYSKLVRRFLKSAEKFAAVSSDFLISDSIAIKSYIKKKYNRDSKFIAYGANLFFNESEQVLLDYQVEKYKYNMLIARLEPENNIETILDGVERSDSIFPFLVVGKHETKFGEFLKNKFSKDNRIKFLGGIYNIEHLDNLRFYSNLYFHGHSVGGTNPSLLEAMASSSFIIAHDNDFNKSILGEDAFYFLNSNDVKLQLLKSKNNYSEVIQANLNKIENEFSWPIINGQYEDYMSLLVANKKF
jgi:glycosyltransferase involved in cell wall biosynthesis